MKDADQASGSACGAEGFVIILSDGAPAASRWLAHLVRASVGAIRSGDRFDDDLPFEPEAVLRLALRHRVAPILHRSCEQGRIADPLPEAFRGACGQAYYATVRKNVIALETGRDVLMALSAAEIDVAPLKGWALLEGPGAVYDDVGTRPMDDLDLIVQRPDRARAMEVLRELGFSQTTARAPGAMEAGHEAAFHVRTFDVDLFVELHWAWASPESLMRSFGVSGERFLKYLCRPCASHARVRAPTRLGNLLFGAVHAGRHSFERWIWLFDLHRLVTQEPLDWDALVRSARFWRASRPLYAGLLATRELLRTPVPKEVLADLAPGPVRRHLLHRSLAAGARGATRPARVAKLLLGESWWDVARTAAWAALPGPGYFAGRGAAATPRRRLAHPVQVLLESREGHS